MLLNEVPLSENEVLNKVRDDIYLIGTQRDLLKVVIDDSVEQLNKSFRDSQNQPVDFYTVCLMLKNQLEHAQIAYKNALS